MADGRYLQPDANLPGLESFVRHIAEGRRYFLQRFGITPRVAYNFDSFGHHGGLPQILRLAGYDMYIHMRPQPAELTLPNDLYRWRGVDGSEILTLRIPFGLYHTERDNIRQRIREGTELALRLGRDVPLFWGLGDHGGGATRDDLQAIDEAITTERRVELVHSTPDRLYACLLPVAAEAPVVEGDLQRVFTGCYTSLSRLKRAARQSLAQLSQCEVIRSATWWLLDQPYAHDDFEAAWQDHLLNDFHDILPGTCVEPAERDALDLYGRVSESTRRMRLAAAIAIAHNCRHQATLPVTVLNANTALPRVPVEVEFMVDYRPLWTGTWRTRLFTPDGSEVPAQEEQPEPRLPFNGWRRKLCFMADLPGVGASFYRIEVSPDEPTAAAPPPAAALAHTWDATTGLVREIVTHDGVQCLAGPLLQPLVLEDAGDSWGTNVWRYRDLAGQFAPVDGPTVVEQGPIRTITESTFSFSSSRLLLRTVAYATWPVLEFQFRVSWNETRRRLKLAIPTVFRDAEPLCEIPGGSIRRPCDGEQNVHGRWFMMAGECGGRQTAIGVVNSGQHGIDCADGTVTLSVLRSAAYCHEFQQSLNGLPATKYMDQGVHDFRLLVTAGSPEFVQSLLPGLADWLDAPPVAYAHLPWGTVAAPSTRTTAPPGPPSAARNGTVRLLSLEPPTIRITACTPSRDGNAILVRCHETAGKATAAKLALHSPAATLALQFRPFELVTLRIERDGTFRSVPLIEDAAS